MSLARRTAVGIIWNFVEQVSRRGIGLIITLLLARFLTPDDYGLVAMMTIFITIANELMHSGFKQALIRKIKVTKADYNTAFYSNLILGLISYLLLFVCAPFIADFYQEPELTKLIRVAGTIIIINSFQVIQSAVLNRNIRFKMQLQATIPATLVSGIVALLMAFTGFGVWALVAQMIISTLISTFILWNTKLWRPALVFSKKSFRNMYQYGSKIFISSLLEILFQNMYIITIAKLFTTTVAGYYFFAKKITDIIANQLVRSIQTVTFPALATLQEDNTVLKTGYKKVMQVTTFLLFPAMIFTAALAKPFFIVFFNEQWFPTVLYLQLMCIAGMIRPLQSINMNVLQVKGRSDILLHLSIVNQLVAMVILIITIQYGIKVILIGQIASSLIMYVPNSYYSGKLVNYPIKEQIYDFLPCLVVSLGIAILTYYGVSVSTFPAFLNLLIFGFFSVFTYAIISYFLNIEAIDIVKQTIKKTTIKTFVDKT